MRAGVVACFEEWKKAMIVSEVNIQLIKPCDGLVGFASVVLDDQIYLSSIGIHQRLDGTGYRITYPTKKTGNRSFDVFHPIKKEIGQKIEEAVLSKIAEIMSKAHGSQHRKGGGDADE